MNVLEVFADVACPFAHVGLRRFVALRAALGRDEPVLRVRAWPLELVDGQPERGDAVAAKVEALREVVAPDSFVGFDPKTFPSSTRPALESTAAAYRLGPGCGERFSLVVRAALFEDGRDVADPAVLAALRAAAGVGEPTEADAASVEADHEEGRRRGVVGSPHFFTAAGDFFCPSLDIENSHGELSVTFDDEGFRRFIGAALGATR